VTVKCSCQGVFTNTRADHRSSDRKLAASCCGRCAHVESGGGTRTIVRLSPGVGSCWLCRGRSGCHLFAQQVRGGWQTQSRECDPRRVGGCHSSLADRGRRPVAYSVPTSDLVPPRRSRTYRTRRGHRDPGVLRAPDWLLELRLVQPAFWSGCIPEHSRRRARGVHKLDPPANQHIRRRDRVNAPHGQSSAGPTSVNVP
jgi:hypothetical protein